MVANLSSSQTDQSRSTYCQSRLAHGHRSEALTILEASIGVTTLRPDRCTPSLPSRTCFKATSRAIDHQEQAQARKRSLAEADQRQFQAGAGQGRCCASPDSSPRRMLLLRKTSPNPSFHRNTALRSKRLGSRGRITAGRRARSQGSGELEF